MESAIPRLSIRLGIDLGSTTFRVAYVHPDTEKAVVPVPLTLEQFQPCFPIAEQLPSNDLYTPRFFPGLLQRLQSHFELNLFGTSRSTRAITAELLKKAVAEAKNFAGREIERLLLCHPIAVDAEARAGLQEALNIAGLTGALSSDAEAACSFFRATEMKEDEHATVLVFSAGFTGLGVAAARITPRGVRVLAKAGDPAILGGNVLDFAIMQSAMRCLGSQRILFSDGAQPKRWSEFQYQVELAKHSIRNGDGAEFCIPNALTPSVPEDPIRLKISGPIFRALVSEHLDRALSVVTAMLEDTGIQETELGYVLLLGGTTHLPDVSTRLQERLAAANLRHLPPEAVASGSALLAMEQSPESADRDPFTVAGSEPFIPHLREIPELVSFATAPWPDPAGKSTSVEKDVASPVAPPSPASEVAVETLTLESLRARINLGDTNNALRDLERLQRAVQQELDHHLAQGEIPLPSTN